MKQILILGGGFGGVKLASKLAGHPDFRVQLISDRPYFQYYPALYRAATGNSHLESAIPFSDILPNQANIEITLDKAVELDPAQHMVKTKSGKEFTYDELVIAIGNVTNYFGIRGLKKYSYGIKSVEEAMDFKHHLHQELIDEHKADLNYVVIGGGPTGVELTGALYAYLHKIMRTHKISMKNVSIDLIEAAPQLLPRSHPKISTAATMQLKHMGIKIMTGKTVKAETYNSLEIGGEKLATKTVVWTAGVTNNPFFANQPGVFKFDKHGKVIVDRHLKAAEHVYVIGDNASTTYAGMAQTALHDARFIAKNFIRKSKGYGQLKYHPQRPFTVIPIGIKWAAAEWGGFRLTGYPAWLVRKLADLMAYREIEPTLPAIRTWLSDNKPEEDCPICAKKTAKTDA